MKKLIILLFLMMLIITTGCGLFYQDREYYDRESKQGTGGRHGASLSGENGRPHDDSGIDGNADLKDKDWHGNDDTGKQ